jgi:uncharacterized phage protein gp47/JayE
MATPSFDDLYNLGKAEMLLRRPDLFINEGDVSDVILNAAAAMADKAIGESVANLRKTFLDTASGDDLTTLVQDHFNLIRAPATLAFGALAFTRTSGPLLAGTIPAGTVVATSFDANGKRVEVTTDAAIAWIAAETGTKTVEATCTVTGPEGNVAANTLVNIISNLFDTTFTVTNLAVFAGGNDEEPDSDLRNRAKNYSSTLRRGTLAALEFGALQVPEARNATAVEETLSGLVTVYVSDENGNSNAQLISDVEDELENWRCAGTVVDVQGGVLVTQNISITVGARIGFDLDAVKPDIEAAIEESINKLKIGDDLYHDLIQSAVRAIDPENIVSVTVVTPAANPAVVAANQIVKAGTITINGV